MRRAEANKLGLVTSSGRVLDSLPESSQVGG